MSIISRKIAIATLVAGISLVFIQCKDPEGNRQVSDLKVTFKVTYDGSSLEKYKDYLYDNHPLEFSRFTLFLSDVTLLNGAEGVKVSDVEYLDFLPDNASDNLSVLVSYTFKEVPDGTYTGIRMGYGVNATNNAKDPSDFPPSNPLYNDNEYWLGWKSYIFCKIEGQGDADNDGQFDHFLIYHCGGDGVYKVFEQVVPITVSPEAQPVQVEFDLRKLFIMDDGRYYNMVVNPATSNKKDSLRIANDIMRKFGEATRVIQ